MPLLASPCLQDNTRFNKPAQSRFKMVFSCYTFNLTPSQVLKNKEKMKHLHFSSYTSCCCDAVSANVMCYNEAAAAAADDHSLLPVRLL